MKTIVVANPGTGEIMRVVSCPVDDVGSNSPVDMLTLEIDPSLAVSGNTHFVDSVGNLTAYTLVQQESKATQPKEGGIWSNTSFSWVVAWTLAQRKAYKWDEIKAARNAAITTPKSTSVGLFDADETSQNNLNKVIALVQIAASLGAPAEANYTLATNERVLLTLPQLSMAALEMGAQVQTMYDRGNTLRTQINAAIDIPAVEAITWSVT